jgi:hypothetical protein
MRVHGFGILLIAAAAPALAHHSVVANFDAGTTVEAEGVISNIAWRNPHILFTLTTADGTELTLDTHSLSIMRRLGAAEPFVEVGDTVRVAGWPSRRGEGMFVNNMLLPSGEEFVFDFGAEPADLRWSDRMWGSNENWFAESGDASAEDRGIFRVWSTTFAGGGGFFLRGGYPLTEEAQAFNDSFDILTEDPLFNCAPKGVPAIMSAPYPFEFSDRGDTIEMHIEEYDTLRTIYMNPASTPEPSPSILGHSTGHWEGETLVVETTHVNWGHLDGRGAPMSEQAIIVERFTPTDSGGRLEYELTVTDPANFTEPVVRGKSWVWLPDVRVEPYECTLREAP